MGQEIGLFNDYCKIRSKMSKNIQSYDNDNIYADKNNGRFDFELIARIVTIPIQCLGRNKGP